MNRLKSKKKINEKVKKIRSKAEEILNKGVMGGEPSKLQNTLESHQSIKILLDEMEYTLQQDIPDDYVLIELSNIMKEMESIEKESER